MVIIIFVMTGRGARIGFTSQEDRGAGFIAEARPNGKPPLTSESQAMSSRTAEEPIRDDGGRRGYFPKVSHQYGARTRDPVTTSFMVIGSYIRPPSMTR